MSRTTTPRTTVLRGGTVVDGTGAVGRPADVRIAGGHIDDIGPGLDGDDVVDVGGAVVAPGFIDIHTHYDAQVFWDPAMTPSCFHGVSTVVAGNCGFSLAPTLAADRETIALTLEQVEDMDPAALIEGVAWDFESFPEYLASVARHGHVLNFGAYIGHTPLRLRVMGHDASDRAATPEETATMAAMVGEAMQAGALGFATSLAVTHNAADGRPIPSRLADRGELEILCGVVATAGRGVVAVNGGPTFGFTDTYDLADRLGIPVTYTALLTVPDGRHLKALKIHRERRDRGSQVRPQVSCRPLTFSMSMVEPFTLNTNPVFAALINRPLPDRRAAFADTAWRDRVRAAWAQGRGLLPDWARFSVMESAAHPELIGETLDVVAAGRSADAFDVLLDVTLDEPDLALRVRAVIANSDVDGVETLLNEEGCVLGLSDAGAHVGQLCDAPLPTDLLGSWVRDRGTMSLERAVFKLTGEPASLFGLTDRGVLRPGACADVTVFDPATVAPGPLRRVRDFPAASERLTADEPSGMVGLWVNGRRVVADGALTGSALEDRPGRIVRPGPHA